MCIFSCYNATRPITRLSNFLRLYWGIDLLFRRDIVMMQLAGSVRGEIRVMLNGSSGQAYGKHRSVHLLTYLLTVNTSPRSK